MRILPAALALSATLHGVALGWVITRNHAQLHASAPPVPHVDVVDIEPMAVALLDDHTVVPALPLPGTPSGEVGTQISAAGRHGATETPAGHGSAGPNHSSLMDMRKPEIDKGLSGDFIGKFLSKVVVPQPNPIEGERIGDDIEATEHDLHDASWMSHASPDQVTAARQKLVALEDARDGHELKQDGDGYKATHDAFTAQVEPDGTAHIHDKFTFDATDAAMRHFGEDPYSSNKRKFLDDTREERYQIGKRYEHRQLQHSAILAKQTLDWMWTKTRDTSERKEALFELWDDCAETGDDDLVAGGRAARNVIVGFIRAHVTGADAFTTEELVRLNAHKKSTATFAPYDD